MAPPANGIRQCTTPGCFTLTRSSRYKAAEYPGSSLRMKGGVCVDCYVPDQPPCIRCNVPLRIAAVPAALMPGAKARYADGMCLLCWQAVNPDKVTQKPVPEPLEPVTAAKLEYTIKGLDAFIARRRARLGVAA